MQNFPRKADNRSPKSIADPCLAKTDCGGIYEHFLYHILYTSNDVSLKNAIPRRASFVMRQKGKYVCLFLSNMMWQWKEAHIACGMLIRRASGVVCNRPLDSRVSRLNWPIYSTVTFNFDRFRQLWTYWKNLNSAVKF